MEMFEGPHSGRRIANFTLTTCGDWNITNKIVRIGTDNGSNMVNAFSEFEELIELNENLENLDDGSPTVEHLDEDYDSFDEETLAFDEIDNSVIEEAVEKLSRIYLKIWKKHILNHYL